ncbi:MAG TPA: hypothetical protein VK003_03475 [Oceanobacillus sp.]|nr:hypothetical protein [Oceanobacillus sp.]
MYEQELYELARQRIDARNRRWKLWSFNLAGYLIAIGVFIALALAKQAAIGMLLFMTWTGVFVLHCILLGMAESRAKDIEKEVTKLREAATYEKPKRLELGDDGELVEIEEEQLHRLVQ